MDEQISAEYLKGFNDGYLLSKHEPELAVTLTAALTNSERSMGFKAGKEEFQREIEKSKLPTWLKKDRLSNLNKSDLTIGKDDIEQKDK